MQKKHFNFQEFSKFCEAEIELALEKKIPEAARSWLGMWEQIADEHEPALDYWRQRLRHQGSWFWK